MGPKSNDKWIRDIKRTDRRKGWNHRGQDWSDAATNQGTSWSHQNGRVKEGFSLGGFAGSAALLTP